jgi:hypothetical protein
MAEHTPGEWGYQNDTITSQHGDIARVHYQSSRDKKGWDDRPLIAAAPDLLAALKVADMALDFAQAQVDSERDAIQLRGWRREVQKAINKAEGKVVDV